MPLSRCHTRGESEDHTSEKARKGSSQALKPSANVIRSPKQGNQWPYKKDLCPQKLKKKTKKIFFLPRRGMYRDVCGMLSETINRNTVKERSTVTPSDTFSPAEGGTRNTISCSMLNITQGRMMFRT